MPLLYVVGGRIDCGVDTASVEAYDPVTNTWSVKAPLPAPTDALVVAVVDGKLYAIGGESNQPPPSAATTEYDPAANRWTERAPMPTPRRNAGFKSRSIPSPTLMAAAMKRRDSGPSTCRGLTSVSIGLAS